MSERDDDLFGVIYGATDNTDWAVSEVHDAVLAAGYRKLVLDDATVERAAIALWVQVGEKAEDWVYYPPEDERKAWLTNHAKVVLATVLHEPTP